jgi:large subunit ribosomal protein L7/L12
MNISKNDIVKAIGEMNILDVVDLVAMLESKFNISTQQQKQQNVEQKNIEPKSEAVKTSFDVTLKNFGENKIAVIKVIREITNLGLKEAKQMVESSPIKIKENITEENAKEIKNTLEKCGASVEIN